DPTLATELGQPGLHQRSGHRVGQHLGHGGLQVEFLAYVVAVDRHGSRQAQIATRGPQVDDVLPRLDDPPDAGEPAGQVGARDLDLDVDRTTCGDVHDGDAGELAWRTGELR